VKILKKCFPAAGKFHFFHLYIIFIFLNYFLNILKYAPLICGKNKKHFKQKALFSNIIG